MAKRRPASKRKPDSQIAIRMYCQGLGDCFLLSFPRSDGKGIYRILIDCGVLQRTPQEAERMRSVADSLLKDTGGKIDLLVVTHEHWDHVAGFAHAKDIFEKIEIGRVWLSWAENPNDRDAKVVKTELGKKKNKVQAALGAARRLGLALDDNAGTPVEKDLRVTQDLMNFFGPSEPAPLLGAAKKSGAKRMTLGETMDWLRAKVQPSDYCTPGECRTLAEVDGLKIYVLGPPFDIKSIRKMDPSGDQGYKHQAALSLMGAIDWLADGNDSLPPAPFDERYAVPVQDAHSDPFFREYYGFKDDPLGDDGAGWRRIDDEWLGGVGGLALQLDTGVNNTSLALAFELPDGRTLIFPGDAQIGNWLSWDNVQFKDAHGAVLPITSRQLLNRAVFYKVGHHGSHNATRKVGGLEEMNSGDLVAMIPTDEAFAKTQSPPHGWKMPFFELNEALKTFTNRRIIRVDKRRDEMTDLAENEAETAGWAAFMAKLEFSAAPLLPTMKDRPLFVEYRI